MRGTDLMPSEQVDRKDDNGEI